MDIGRLGLPKRVTDGAKLRLRLVVVCRCFNRLISCLFIFNAKAYAKASETPCQGIAQCQGIANALRLAYINICQGILKVMPRHYDWHRFWMLTEQNRTEQIYTIGGIKKKMPRHLLKISKSGITPGFNGKERGIIGGKNRDSNHPLFFFPLLFSLLWLNYLEKK